MQTSQITLNQFLPDLFASGEFVHPAFNDDREDGDQEGDDSGDDLKH